MNEELVERHSNILMYQTEDGKTRIDVLLRDETVWFTQISMAELFQATVPNINMHIKNILEESGLHKDSTIKDYLIVQNEGKRRILNGITRGVKFIRSRSEVLGSLKGYFKDKKTN